MLISLECMDRAAYDRISELKYVSFLSFHMNRIHTVPLKPDISELPIVSTVGHPTNRLKFERTSICLEQVWSDKRSTDFQSIPSEFGPYPMIQCNS
jgi:hypothetical protein